MKIGLIDVDGHNFPNLPLMKISAYHKRQGHEVKFWMGLEQYDMVYKSKVFTHTPDMDHVIMADTVIEGGTGYGGTQTLPRDIEHIMPDYGLYPQYSEAYGFLTRGCPRDCQFCIVTQKEGPQSRRVADLAEFWTGQKTIKLLDPNLLACVEREAVLQQLAESGAWIDFTQGIDIRFTDRPTIELLNTIKVKRFHFAWDNPSEDLTAQFSLFAKYSGVTDCRRRAVYVLTNFNSTHIEDLERVYTLRDLGYDPYIMVYDKPNAPKITRHLQRWVNNRRIFRATRKFEEFDPKK